MDIALDRFRESVPPHIEARAQAIAAEVGPGRQDPHFLLGYLQASIAVALERPRWRSRDRLAVDLRVVDILRSRR